MTDLIEGILTSSGRGPQEPQTGDTELAEWRESAWDDNAPMTVPSADMRAIITRLDVAEKALHVETMRAEAWRREAEEAHLARIEAQNPGIDIAQVRRDRAERRVS